MELELFALKFEVIYNNKSYIIEAKNYYNETKWIVTCDNNKLRKVFKFTCADAEHNCDSHVDTFFDTKDEAVNALTIYLTVEDKTSEQTAKYKDEITALKNTLGLPFLYKGEETFEIHDNFLSVHEIEIALNKKGCFRISKSNIDCGGVQVSVNYIHNMLLLETVIEEIAKESCCNIINIYNYDVPHCSYTKPLYYYWSCGNDFVRQFALLKHVF